MKTCQRMQSLERAAQQVWECSNGALWRQRIDGKLEGGCISKLLAVADRGGVESLSRIARSALAVLRADTHAAVPGWIEELPSDVGAEA